MNVNEVMSLLKDNQNDRGMEHWNNGFAKDSGLSSFGIGLTVLRKLAKQVGRDRDLAHELWQTDVYDARVIGLLIDDPKQITREQVETQVEQLAGGYLAHVFSTCGATLANAALAQEVASDWMVHTDPIRRRCAHGLNYEMSKSKKKTAPDDDYFLKVLALIDDSFDDEDIDTKMSKGSAVMGIGMRNATLHGPALKLARKICPIDFDPTGACDPFDAVKHLTSDRIKQKLGV